MRFYVVQEEGGAVEGVDEETNVVDEEERGRSPWGRG